MNEGIGPRGEVIPTAAENSIAAAAILGFMKSAKGYEEHRIKTIKSKVEKQNLIVHSVWENLRVMMAEKKWDSANREAGILSNNLGILAVLSSDLKTIESGYSIKN